MNKIKYVQQGISLLTYKAPKIRNIENLGYIRADGQINFANEEAALKYAKNRVVKALNGKKPFERGLIIQGNTVVCECNGNGSSVMFPKDKCKGKFFTVHGHPDEYTEIEETSVKTFKEKLKRLLHLNRKNKSEKNGIALPVSAQDYTSMMMNPNETKAIVYNSKGEYSILEKTQQGQTLNSYEIKELENEYRMEVPCGLIEDFSKFFKKIKRFFISAKKANEQGIADAKNHAQEVHEFLLKNTKDVKYTTNYPYLK